MHQDLIKKYFDNATSPEEKRRLYLYLKNRPGLLESSFSEDEWTQLLQSDIKNYHGNKNVQQLFERIADVHKRKRSRKIRVSVTVVITFIFIVSLGYLFNSNKKVTIKQHAQLHVAALPPYMIEHKNATASLQKITLADGTIVNLEAGSKLRYVENFELEKRDVYMDGAASFKVAKDICRPFTVYCGGVATTALGTEFYINGEPGKNIDVKLLEGKIVVRSVKDTSVNAVKHYLLAGNSISFNRAANKFSSVNNNISGIVLPKESVHEKSGAKQFMGENLPYILNYIEDTYNVKIYYDNEKLIRKRFAGTLRKEETAQDLLRYIAIMNNLILTKDSSSQSTAYFLK